jgi:hypothetical protein
MLVRLVAPMMASKSARIKVADEIFEYTGHLLLVRRKTVGFE